VLQIITPVEYIMIRSFVINDVVQWDGDTFQRFAVTECPSFNSFQFISKFRIRRVFTNNRMPLPRRFWQTASWCSTKIHRHRMPGIQFFPTCHIQHLKGFTTPECTNLNDFDAWHFRSSQRRTATEYYSFNFVGATVSLKFFEILRCSDADVMPLSEWLWQICRRWYEASRGTTSPATPM
jgi:hypothetical protein